AVARPGGARGRRLERGGVRGHRQPASVKAASIFFAASSEAFATSLRPETISWNIVGRISEASIWPQAGEAGTNLAPAPRVWTNGATKGSFFAALSRTSV